MPQRGALQLKICGMKHNVSEVAALNPDYLGFIFWEGSPRHFTGPVPILDPGIQKVGVFVDASLAAILEKANEFGLDAIQLHGNESPAFCAQLKKLMLTPGDRSVKSTAGPGTGGGSEGKVPLVIKVFSIKDRFNFAILTPYEAVCDYYLFDTKGKLPGGNGYTFNWKVLDKYPSDKPYFLSGGIGPESVEKLGHFLKSKTSQYCYAIDVNSAFEIEPGLKDTEKLRIFKGSLQTGHGPIHNP